jgi:hypothetical protein
MVRAFLARRHAWLAKAASNAPAMLNAAATHVGRCAKPPAGGSDRHGATQYLRRVHRGYRLHGPQCIGLPRQSMCALRIQHRLLQSCRQHTGCRRWPPPLNVCDAGSCVQCTGSSEGPAGARSAIADFGNVQRFRQGPPTLNLAAPARSGLRDLHVQFRASAPEMARAPGRLLGGAVPTLNGSLQALVTEQLPASPRVR